MIGYKLSDSNGTVESLAVLNFMSDNVECCLLECNTGIEEGVVVRRIVVVVNGVETVEVSNELMCRLCF